MNTFSDRTGNAVSEIYWRFSLQPLVRAVCACCPMPNARVVVLEHKFLCQYVLKLALWDEYEVLTASDGESALELIRAQEGGFSLILLDLVNTHPAIEGVLSLVNNLFFIAIFISFVSPMSSFARSIWRFFFIKPLEARWCVMGYIVLELLFIWKFQLGDTYAHMAHLGGMFFGFLMIMFWRFSEEKKKKETASKYQWNKPANDTVNDMEYNARKKARQEEIDQILDKIRKSGYDSLSKDEKKRLFEASHEQ